VPEGHAQDLPATGHASRRTSTSSCARSDGGGGHDRRRDHRVPDRALHGALRHAHAEGVFLCRHHAADVDQLSRQGLRVATDPGQAGHRQLGPRQGRPHRRAWIRCSRFPWWEGRRYHRHTSACSSCSSTCGCHS
jgi:hypothetical protein